MKKLLLLFLSGIVLCSANFAQANVDSLEHIISLGKKDNAEAEALNKLVEIYSRKDFSKAKIYLEASYKIAKNLPSQRPLGIIYFHYVNLYQNTGSLDSATYYLKKLEALAQQANIEDREYLEANYCQSAGLYHKKKGELKESIVYYKKALELPGNKNKKDATIAGFYLNLGNAYFGLAQHKAALENHLKALEIFEKIDNKLGKSFCYQALSVTYKELEQTDRSLLYAKKSLAIKLALQDKKSLATAYNMLGNIYLDQELYDKSLQEFEKSLQIAKEMNLVTDEQRALFNIGKTYSKKNEPALANEYFKKAKLVSFKVGDSSFIILVDAEINRSVIKKEDKPLFEKTVVNSLGILDERGDLITKIALYRNTADYYEQQKDYEKALLYTNKYYQLNDSVKGKELLFRIRQMEEQYNVNTKENEIVLLKKDKLINEQKLQRQKILKYSAYAISLLLLLMGLFVIKRVRLGQQVKELKLRNQIAADLHDEVGSSLSSIHLLSQLAAQKETNAASKNILSKMTSNVYEIIERMSDIVWVVKPKLNDKQSLKTRMENFIYEICDGKEIECNFKSDDLTHLNLSMEQRKNLYLIFKEAVNNAVKYSGSKKMDVTILFRNPVFEMSIKDYGKGFNTSTSLQGNGIENMLNRAREIKAKIEWISADAAGTEVKLQVHV